MATLPEGFDYSAYCAEMERRIAEGQHLKKAGDGFYYYFTPPAIESDEHD